jgi:hypothetical protein
MNTPRSHRVAEYSAPTRRSADHLFVSRDLSTWARGRGHRPALLILDGDFQSGGTCTCLQITLRGGAGGGDGLITVVFRGFDLSDWRRREVARSGKMSWFNWVFGPGVVSPQALLERDGYALHLRLDSTDGVSSIEIGTRPRNGGTEWAELDVCTIEEHGISTPLAAEIRTEMRRKRTGLRTATPRPPAGCKSRRARPSRCPSSAEFCSASAGSTAWPARWNALVCARVSGGERTTNRPACLRGCGWRYGASLASRPRPYRLLLARHAAVDGSRPARPRSPLHRLWSNSMTCSTPSPLTSSGFLRGGGLPRL